MINEDQESWRHEEHLSVVTYTFRLTFSASAIWRGEHLVLQTLTSKDGNWGASEIIF